MAMEKKAKVTFWVQKPQLSHAGALLCQGRVPSMLPAVLRWQQNPYRDRIFLCLFYFGVFSLNFSVFLLRFKQNLGQQVLPDVTKSPTALPWCPLDGRATSQVGELRELPLRGPADWGSQAIRNTCGSPGIATCCRFIAEHCCSICEVVCLPALDLRGSGSRKQIIFSSGMESCLAALCSPTAPSLLGQKHPKFKTCKRKDLQSQLRYFSYWFLEHFTALTATSASLSTS